MKKADKEHFEKYDKYILHICATHGQDDVLLQILLRKNEEGQTVFELCNNQKVNSFSVFPHRQKWRMN